MLKRILRKTLDITLALFLFGSLALCAGIAGFMRGTQELPREFQKEMRLNPLILQWSTIQNQINQAGLTLLQCDYFRTKYPTAYVKLIILSYTKVLSIGYAPQYDDIFIAAADPTGYAIYLTDNFFALPYEERVAVLLHEYLHLVGLPGHKEDLNRAFDEVYITTAKCTNVSSAQEPNAAPTAPQSDN